MLNSNPVFLFFARTLQLSLELYSSVFVELKIKMLAVRANDSESNISKLDS